MANSKDFETSKRFEASSIMTASAKERPGMGEAPQGVTGGPSELPPSFLNLADKMRKELGALITDIELDVSQMMEDAFGITVNMDIGDTSAMPVGKGPQFLISMEYQLRRMQMLQDAVARLRSELVG